MVKKRKKKVEEKNLKLEELRRVWTMKDLFEFLKLSKGKVFFSFLFSVLFTWLFWSVKIATLLIFPLETRVQLCFLVLLVLIIFLALLVTTYTIISLIIYLNKIWRAGK